jgi:chromate reductase, NAD(P)H dehydrogenase (quinone)
MLVLGVPGSLRTGSYNRRLLRAAAGELPPGVELQIWDGLGLVPPYDADADGAAVPVAVEELRGAFAGADALLIATPEYNRSLPGQLKNALDWASRPFPESALRDKPVAVIGASTGLFGAVWAQAELRKVLAASGARVVDADLPVGRAHEAFEADGSLRDPELRVALGGLLDQLLDEAGAEAPISLAV